MDVMDRYHGLAVELFITCLYLGKAGWVYNILYRLCIIHTFLSMIDR